MSDMQMFRGDTMSFDVTVTRFNPVTGVDDIVNLTGAKAWFTAKRSRGDADVNASIQLNSVSQPSQVIITPAAGKISITINPADTQNLTNRWLRYDVQVKEASGAVSTVASGKLELVRDTTIVQT